MTRREAVDFLLNRPADFAKMVGFNKLTSLHNEWIKEMVQGTKDHTLQSHRGSYKTTCVSVALAIQIILLPNLRTMFMRKTDADVKEVVKQVQKILSDPHALYFVQCIYGVNLKLNTQSTTEITTNLTTDKKGTVQLLGIGLGGSITGKHFDRIFTDDIVNVKDRISKAERDHTITIYQELQNVKNQGGKIFNTGTPWHKEDAFSIMPDAERHDCYSTGIIPQEELEKIKGTMLPSLFACNYELRHIASEDVIFENPQTGADTAKVEQGIMHVDSAFYGEDYTAWCIMRKAEEKYYIHGRCRRKHVEECYADILADYQRFMCGKLYTEDNADKGFVAKDLRKMGIKAITYTEHQNKYLKIVTYLKAIWKDAIFTADTDKEFIEQICDYFEDAAHDDCPDTVASLARLLYGKAKSEYSPLWN